jgi:type II secretory pathway pseudopilin PulG
LIPSRRQQGATGALIVAVLVFVLLGVMAAYLLSRVASGTGDQALTAKRLAAASEALDQYAGATSRLPCPADPALDTGIELTATAATCTYPEGTLPWATIGMKREDAFDSWGRKVSYRVYTGTAGSLTQPGGASMVECDTLEDGAGPATATDGAGSGRLCLANPDPYQRATRPANFLAGKGLTVDDAGTPRTDIAYVLVSHGATGLGGYSISGARLDLPLGEERDNTRATGPFTVRAFSDSDTPATKSDHFDDLLALRTIPDLVRRANLAARNWPDAGALFSEANIEAILGRDIVAGQGVGETTLDFGGVRVSGIGTGGTATEIAFDVVGGVGGLGMENGLSTHLESGANEFLRFDFTRDVQNFAVTLNHFGAYFTASGDFPGFEVYLEQAEFRFYFDEALVATVIKAACAFDGGLASFSFPAGATFDRVDVTPLASSNLFPPPPSGISTFLVSEVKACLTGEGACTTSLSDASNTCT